MGRGLVLLGLGGLGLLVFPVVVGVGHGVGSIDAGVEPFAVGLGEVVEFGLGHSFGERVDEFIVVDSCCHGMCLFCYYKYTNFIPNVQIIS